MRHPYLTALGWVKDPLCPALLGLLISWSILWQGHFHSFTTSSYFEEPECSEPKMPTPELIFVGIPLAHRFHIAHWLSMQTCRSVGGAVESQRRDEGQHLTCSFLHIEIVKKGLCLETTSSTLWCYQPAGPASYWHLVSCTYLCFTWLR